MKKKRIILIALSTTAVISAVVLSQIMKQDDVPEASPFGIFSIFDSSQNGKEEVEEKTKQQISFYGYGKCKVSKNRPAIELYNPRENSVKMVFTLSDAKSGELIARTDEVAPGKYVYVDVVSFYRAHGTYNVNIDTSTIDAETGMEMNGMHQEMEVTIQ